MDINKLFNIDGKTALITGGSRGIGEMIAAGFLANGVKVYITARKEAPLIEKQRSFQKNLMENALQFRATLAIWKAFRNLLLTILIMKIA